MRVYEHKCYQYKEQQMTTCKGPKLKTIQGIGIGTEGIERKLVWIGLSSKEDREVGERGEEI